MDMILNLYVFIVILWALIIAGGFITVQILGPIHVSGYEEFNDIISSGIKFIVALILVIIWVFILSKIKNKIFLSKK